jgi:hypothetical protein
MRDGFRSLTCGEDVETLLREPHEPQHSEREGDN